MAIPGERTAHASDTTYQILQARRKVDMHDQIFLLDPNENPITLVSSKFAKRKAINPKFSWLEDAYAPEWVYANYSTGYTAGATSIVVNDSSAIPVGALLQVISTSGPGEVVRVSANVVASNAMTISRGVGSVSASTISDQQALHLIGVAYEEYSAIPGAFSTQTVERTNYCQIFRLPITLSRTLMDSELYGGKDMNYQRNKKGKEFARMVENAFLWGDYGTFQGTTHYGWLTAGLYYFINTYASGNILDVGGTLAETDFRDWLRTVFRYGSKEKWLFCAPLIASAIDHWMGGHLNLTPRDTVGGIAIGQYISSHGILNVVIHKMLEDPSVGAGFGGWAFALDMSEIGYRFLQNEDVELLIDRVRAGADGQTDEYRACVGLECRHPSKHAIMWGVQDYS